MPAVPLATTHLDTLYDTYHHFDIILSSPNFQPANVEGKMLQDFWLLIKALHVPMSDKNLDEYVARRLPASLMDELARQGVSPVGLLKLLADHIVDFANEQSLLSTRIEGVRYNPGGD